MIWSCNGATTPCWPEKVNSTAATSLTETKHKPTVTPPVLTDFKLPLYSLHISLSVLGLDGVTVTHQLHKLSWQDTVLEERGHSRSTLLHFQHSNKSTSACRIVFIRSNCNEWEFEKQTLWWLKTNLRPLHPNIYGYIFSIFLSFLKFNA